MNIRFPLALLAICGAGAFTGVMLNIGLTLGSFWKSIPPAAFLDWFADNEFRIVRSIAVVAIPTAIGVLGSLLLSLGRPRALLWWSVATGALVTLAAITMIFHLPINAAFASRSMPLADVGAAVDSWLAVHAARIMLGLLATVAGVVALTR